MSTVLTDKQAKQYLAENLRQLIAEHGVTQSALAGAIDVTPMTVTYYLQAKRMAGSGPLARLAEFFGVSTDFLLKKPSQKKTQKSA